MRKSAPLLQQAGRARRLLVEREALAAVAAALVTMAADLERHAEAAERRETVYKAI